MSIFILSPSSDHFAPHGLNGINSDFRSRPHHLHHHLRNHEHSQYLPLHLDEKFQNKQSVNEGGRIKFFYHPYMQVSLSLFRVLWSISPQPWLILCSLYSRRGILNITQKDRGRLKVRGKF